MADKIKQVINDSHNSWASRNGFSDWVLAILWIITAFLLFQIAAGVIAGLLLALQKNGPIGVTDMQSLVENHLDLLFIGNTTGQVLFLGIGSWLFSRLHASKRDHATFMRFKANSKTPKKIALAIVLIVVVQPGIALLGWLNSFVPVPEFFAQLQVSQMKMIGSIMSGDQAIWIVILHVSVVPAICEETLYRGYVLSAFQKSWGIWPAIMVSGLFFGMYHVQLSNLLPLASLGMLFAYVAWTSKSIYPAIVIHFINNAGTVIIGKYYPNSAIAESSAAMLPPMIIVIPSLLLSGLIVYYMYNEYQQTATQTRSDYV